MNPSRWHMNRAGLFNFWFYTDDVFQLSEGRLIFRGANGAGKSVTMQSFLPLVLDGDKRPSRLDPFGSKDRKIEYYLLGDGDSGTTDRTGYVYLEFLQPDTGKTLTIGIGLRARRGAAQVGFWGFALTDGRRVGVDFFLYDEAVYAREGEKVPLDRAGLEAAIGEGGRVVREQGEYRKLVNQLLFGFDDPEAFKDLLTLMIQLRSPKLSKDFRPSTIYSILNEALPPLGEDELKPLSDVLQDMDEISDRLDELVMHRDAAERLHKAYEIYNQMWLYNLAKQVHEAGRAVDAATLNVSNAQQSWEQLQTEHDRLTRQLEEAQAAEEKARAELDALEHSEAMGIQKELESEHGRLLDNQTDLTNTEKRLTDAKTNLARKHSRLEQAKRGLADELHACEQQLATMDALAADIEFTDHAAYAESLKNGEQAFDESIWTSWRKDLRAYRDRLEQGISVFAEERRARERLQDEERRLSSAREQRDQREAAVQAKERELAEALAVQEDALYAWYQGIACLPLSKEAWREMLHTLRQFPTRSYQQAVEPVQAALAEARRTIDTRQLQAEHVRRLKVEERVALQEELEAWKNRLNPEPPRSEARQQSRQRRLEAAGQTSVGAPFYMLCEFKDDVDEATRAALETALHAAGLLDAWVSREAVVLTEGEEDVWLRPNPVLFGYTLAEYLKPTPPEDCGLTTAQVEDVLRTIRIGDAGDAGQAYVTADGKYCIGPLTGQSASKPAAEWIGYEARKRTRLAAMERLRREIQELDGEIAQCEGELQALADQLLRVEAEYAALPGEAPLHTAHEALAEAKRDFHHATKVEQECTVRFRALQATWREAQQRVAEFTAQWQALKQEDDFRQALQRVREYEDAFREYKASSDAAERSRADVRHLEEELVDLTGRMDAEDLHLREVRRRIQTIEARMESLRQALEQLGVLDVYQRQQELKSQWYEWKQASKGLYEELQHSSEQLGRASEHLSNQQDALTTCEAQFTDRAARFRDEWNLRLVRFDDVDPLQWGDLATAAALQKAARDILRAYRSRCESHNLQHMSQRLQEQFAVEKNTLLDYAMESRYDETLGRLFIESTRDRHRRVTPLQVHEELTRLVEEQRILISDKDRELYEQVLIHSVGRAIRDKINRAEQWVKEMNQFMAERNTSSGLVLSLQWTPKSARNERELDTERLVHLLRKSPNTLRPEELEQMIEHFRSRIGFAKEEAEETSTLSRWIGEFLDYRTWFSFTLYFRKGAQPRKELTDAQFNVLSGGEKAMAMYIPLFAATDSRYKDSRPTAPRLVSLDEAFAGVDDENMRDMFKLLTDMEFDYMMTSQQLWGCYDTVPSLSIYEIIRPNDADFVTLIPYYWNGQTRHVVTDGDWDAMRDVATTEETQE